MRTRRAASERGAILIQVGVAILVLSAFLMFIVDYGIMWVSRNQAQNSADAGALAGAIALGLDDPDDYSPGGPAQVAASSFALNNDVWGEDPSVLLDEDITFSQQTMVGFPPECATKNCIRVEVRRNQERANPLPMWFGQLIGLTEQGVRASAVAWTLAGNASRCMKPWAVADKWIENYPNPGPWTPQSQYQPNPNNGVPDEYVPPTADDPGTGFTLANDLGTELTLKVGQPNQAINPGWFQALDLTLGPDGGVPQGQGGGAQEYESYIRGCSPYIWKIGDNIPKENGNMVGPTGQGTNDLIDLDPNAEWDGTKVVNSCVENNSCVDLQGNPVTYSESPRIVSIPVFDLDEYLATQGPGNGVIKGVNILGFFVDRVENPQNSVVGYLATKSEIFVNGAGEVSDESSFVKVIQLVR